jgi:hypothetical protein
MSFPAPSSARDAAVRDHAEAVASFLADARAVPDEAWERPTGDDKWTPAQVCEHVRLTYATVRDELRGGAGFRIRTSWWRQRLLQWRVLPRILASGRMPSGVRAPREIRPPDGPYPREALLAALEEVARAVEDDLAHRWSDPSCTVTHHLIGRLEPARAVPLLATHTRHHARQLVTTSA